MRLLLQSDQCVAQAEMMVAGNRLLQCVGREKDAEDYLEVKGGGLI